MLRRIYRHIPEAGEHSRAVRGFTLGEVLIVVGIVSALAAVSIPSVMISMEESRERTDADNIRAAYSELTTLAMSYDTSDSSYDKDSKTWKSAAIPLTQEEAGWQSSDIAESLAAIATVPSDSSVPPAKGVAYVTYSRTSNGGKKAQITYADGGGASSVKLDTTSEVATYLMDEFTNVLKDPSSPFAAVTKMTANGSPVTGKYTLPNGKEINAIVFSRDYDTFQDVKTRLTTADTATFIYNRNTGKIGTIIYYDGKNYTSWTPTGGWQDGMYDQSEHKK